MTSNGLPQVAITGSSSTVTVSSPGGSTVTYQNPDQPPAVPSSGCVAADLLSVGASAVAQFAALDYDYDVPDFQALSRLEGFLSAFGYVLCHLDIAIPAACVALPDPEAIIFCLVGYSFSG